MARAPRTKAKSAKVPVRAQADASLGALGKTIVALRGEMTQKELARAAKIDVGTLSRLENGRFNPSFKMLEKIANVLKQNAVTSTDEPAAGFSPLIYAAMTPDERELLKTISKTNIKRKMAHAPEITQPAIDAAETARHSRLADARRLQALVEVSDRMRKALLLLLGQVEVAEGPRREIQALLEPAKTA
jgi:transcriptional regulator with XRE-family HTH domain